MAEVKVIGVNPCMHVDQIPADFPHRSRVWHHGQEARPSVVLRETPSDLSELS